MELSREIYWNVGHGASTLVPMYLLTLVAFGVLGWGIWNRLKLYQQGKAELRWDDVPGRVTAMLREVVLQSRVLRVRGPGMAHALFFWGFLLLFIGTCLIVLQADFSDLLFDIVFLKGPFYLGFSLVLDLAGLVAIAMLIGLIVRRWVVRPAGLETSRDDYIMHGLLLAILLTGFFIEGARMAVTENGLALAAWSPVGRVFAAFLLWLGEPALLAIHQVLWWLHLVLALCFIGLIPFTKFKHLVTTSANYFLADRGPVGKLTNLNLEDEDAESFGASQVSDLSWKDIFDTDACTLCKRCQDRCPAWATEKPLSPMLMVNRIGEMARDALTAQQGGEADPSDLVEGLGRDLLWSCTTCRACQDICPAGIEHVRKIVDVRRKLVLMEGEFPGDEVMTAMEQTEVNGNPLGMGYAGRGDWAEGLELTPLEENPDVLFFVGCYGSFDKRNIKVAKSFISLCKAAGVTVGILGKDEKCCGEPMRKMGNEYLYQSLAMENVEMINASGCKKVVTACPHCFNTLSKDYRDFDLACDVVHHAVFLEELVSSGRLQLKSSPLDCTYHDSCYLGRHNDIYEAPRALLKASGANLVEMEKCGDQGFCCGAGGGRILAEEKLGSRINVRRVEMAATTSTGTLVSNCPFCLTMFEDGIKGAGLEETMVARDIAELMVERL